MLKVLDAMSSLPRVPAGTSSRGTAPMSRLASRLACPQVTELLTGGGAGTLRYTLQLCENTPMA